MIRKKEGMSDEDYQSACYAAFKAEGVVTDAAVSGAEGEDELAL